jgi:hypothetical protein
MLRAGDMVTFPPDSTLYEVTETTLECAYMATIREIGSKREPFPAPLLLLQYAGRF